MFLEPLEVTGSNIRTTDFQGIVWESLLAHVLLRSQLLDGRFILKSRLHILK